MQEYFESIVDVVDVVGIVDGWGIGVEVDVNVEVCGAKQSVGGEQESSSSGEVEGDGHFPKLHSGFVVDIELVLLQGYHVDGVGLESIVGQSDQSVGGCKSDGQGGCDSHNESIASWDFPHALGID